MHGELTFDPAKTAVLAMDCQAAIVDMYAGPERGFLPRAAALLAAARAAGMMVIHVRVGFRARLPEISARNPLFGALKASPERQAMFAGAGGEVHPGLGAQAEDITVTKHRVSAFPGTDLDMILRANDISTVILFGIATSGVVLSTLLDACDADLAPVVVSDLCLDNDAELHQALLTRLFPKRASVVESAAVMAAMARAGQ